MASMKLHNSGNKRKIAKVPERKAGHQEGSEDQNSPGLLHSDVKSCGSSQSGILLTESLQAEAFGEGLHQNEVSVQEDKLALWSESPGQDRRIGQGQEDMGCKRGHKGTGRKLVLTGTLARRHGSQ